MIRDEILENDDKKVNSRDIDLLKKNLPQFFDVDGNFNMDKFKEMLKTEDVNFQKESYELKFLGKNFARYQTATNTETVLVPDVVHNEKEENKNSENLYIIGDNIDALKHLINSYSNKIKCIYIDPPYNTGNDGFVYPDNFAYDVKTMSRKMGVSEDEAERIIDMKGKSTHSAWLTFMYPRLLLARDLLADDGVIFISIDENEQANLKFICDEIYGEENYIENFIWIKNSTKNLSKTTSTNHEYILCYCKNISVLSEKEMFRVEKRGLDGVNKILEKANNENWTEKYTEDKLKEYYKQNSDLKGITGYTKVEKRKDKTSGLTYLKVYTLDNMSAPMSTGKAQTYDLIHPKTGLPCVSPTSGWRYTRETIDKHLKDDMIYFYEDHTKIPRFKRFLDTVTTEVKKSVINDFNDGKKNLQKLFDEAYFDNAKPISLIQWLLEITKPNSIILDFFSGSATTAHAVMQLNAEDGGNRKYIMVQIPEIIDKKKLAYQAGYKTIDEIGRERIKRAAKKIKEETKADIDYGFKLIRLEDVPDNTLDKLIDFDPNVIVTDDYISIFDSKETKGKDVILTTWLNQDGYGMNAKPYKLLLDTYELDVCGKSAYIIDKDITSKDIFTLIQKIEKKELLIDRLVVYPYSIPFNLTHELKNNMKQLRNNKTVTLINRY